MKRLAPALILALSACAQRAPEPPPTVPPPPPCPVVTSTNWRATLATPPGATGAQIVVTGKITFPYPGWREAWPTATPATDDPSRLIVEFDPTAKQGAQDPAVQQVRSAWPASPTITSVKVTCRGTVLAENIPVQRAP